VDQAIPAKQEPVPFLPGVLPGAEKVAELKIEQLFFKTCGPRFHRLLATHPSVFFFCSSESKKMTADVSRGCDRDFLRMSDVELRVI
jgi:hypothetical protein